MSESRRQKSKTGCIGCRLRRKKCGEEKPACAGCLRNGLLCTWPDPNSKEHNEILRRTNPRGRNESQSSARPISTGRSSEDGYTSSVPASVVSRDTPEGDFDVLSSHMSELALRHPLLKRPESRVNFEHYICKTSRAIATFHAGDSPFLTELVPFGLANQPVMNAILACSGIHLAQFTKTEVSNATWIHYGQAIQGQRESLTQLSLGQKQDVVPLLVAAILLCIVETFRNGSGAVALHHLKAARWLLRQALDLPPARLNPTLKTFLIERYIYMVAVAHVTVGTEGNGWILDDASRLCTVLQTAEVGHAHHEGMHSLFKLMPLVTIFAQRAREIKAQDRHQETWKDYRTLHDSLMAWTPRKDDQIQRSCGILYQQALLAYLASSIDFWTIAEDIDPPIMVIERAFRTIQELVTLPDANQAVLTMLCWPLAVLGSCARTTSQKDWIKDQFESLARKYASESLTDTLQLLKKLWMADDVGKQGPSRFAELMEQNKMPVLFF